MLCSISEPTFRISREQASFINVHEILIGSYHLKWFCKTEERFSSCNHSTIWTPSSSGSKPTIDFFPIHLQSILNDVFSCSYIRGSHLLKILSNFLYMANYGATFSSVDNGHEGINTNTMIELFSINNFFFDINLFDIVIPFGNVVPAASPRKLFLPIESFVLYILGHHPDDVISIFDTCITSNRILSD